MQSESKVLSSCIPAWGTLLQPQSSLRNWDLILSLSGTAVLNMISGLLPHSPLPRNSDVTDAQACTCSLPFRGMRVRLSLRHAKRQLEGTGAVWTGQRSSAVFCSATRWDPQPVRNVSLSVHAESRDADHLKENTDKLVKQSKIIFLSLLELWAGD